MAKYTEKQKVKAVEAYRKGTGGLRAIAQAHGINDNVVHNWRKLLREDGPKPVARFNEFVPDVARHAAMLPSCNRISRAHIASGPGFGKVLSVPSE